jgi:hypothetical protein
LDRPLLCYVQPLPNSLKLVTPFMRLNISYKRFKKTTATEMRISLLIRACLVGP